MGKIQDINSVAEIAKTSKRSVGLITGCFDIIHKGHIDLIRFAHDRVDLLIIGVDDDANVKRLKGKDRPIHSVEQRMIVLSEMESVDFVFPINDQIDYDTSKADEFFLDLYRKISPTTVFTTPVFDKYFGNKLALCSKLGIQLTQLSNNLYFKSKIRIAKVA